MPSMNRSLMLLLQAFAAILVFFGFLRLVGYIWDQTEHGKIDYCLDAGGSWDYELKKCEGARPGYKGP
jgi:hypothetical protein